jgi:Lamin Tail Domain
MIKSIYSIVFLGFIWCFITGCKKEDSSNPSQLYIYSVIASPTANESVTLKNNSGATLDLSGWTIGDKNNSTSYNIPSGVILIQGETRTFNHSILGFQINDSGEIIYLINSNGTTIDTWQN